MAENLPKKSKIGGPLLGAGAKAITKAAKGPQKAASDGARGLGERLQGRAADRANRSGSIVGRILFGNLGGQVLPTRRATANRVQRGHDWDAGENSLTSGTLKARNHRVAHEHGVAAGKAVWVEACANGGRNAEQAIILLLRSSSWVEFQDSLIPRGRNQGKRVTEIGAWQDVLSNPDNTDLWSLVGPKRPDLTPDVMQGAENALSAMHNFEFRYDRVPGDRPDVLDQLSRLGLMSAIGRFDIGNIGPIHETLFQEVARVVNATGDASLAQHLYDTLHNMAGIGRVGRDALGTLGGGPKRAALDAALASIGQDYTTI